MMTLLRLGLKSQRFLLPLFLVVVVFQLILGQASSYVLAHRDPPLSIAIQQHDTSPLADELVASLSKIEGFTIVAVGTQLSTEEAFRQNQVQALVIIPEGFGDGIARGKQVPVQFYSAPGIMNRDFAREQVAGVIMQLESRYLLDAALAALGEQPVSEAALLSTDLLDVAYEGPLFQSSPLEVTPVYGVSALLLLLAFLHAAFMVPTREDKRIVMRGEVAFTRQFLVSLASTWIVWLAVIVLYFAFMALAMGTVLDLFVCLGFIAIIFYTTLLAGLLATCLGRQATTWVFLPLFILNMTVGGGVWGLASLSPLFAPLAPVAAVAAGGVSILIGMGALFVAGVVLLVATLVILKSRYRHQPGASLLVVGHN